ncbi:bifunctional DNA-binding transcriptional regulator/O6-methylguanine-DNA methyltransferase Ada [Oscillochloris sp. ZM17-4]|uniref:bifunctional DNA-binding transcriptional regulator/O6-methylguanine-DNA methyltransferase Ada n=1 Tax=Oscillochloris sp. ZM17-4 TaxID=2866714 RepID=UPI001C72CC98|nr:bifunctional DNA-binding transcriptional regulator/O6-methylguanine-DNA methyltransferase Ada [Oscillochloris sp. ZM17-4]MBX0327688.1 bifunctional DNA-binding transcriptional regulator/O6-methylguanine-DNA methyltransferase Ada [Oscillochloris sp. ZM17-4]
MTEIADIALDAERCWEAVAARDGGSDGAFVYAVRSTGIYCRPSCPSRRPRREQVAFFALPDAAELAGFRACKRCAPREACPADPAAGVVAAACAVIAARLEQPPSLDDLGAAVGMSPHHLQRTFKRLVGVSPRAYADALRLDALKGRLRAGERVSEAIDAAGYGSPSRVYERADAQLGMPPAVYRGGGKGMQIGFTIVDSALGRLLVAATGRGLCAVSLGDDDEHLEYELRAEYRMAEIVRDDEIGAAVGVIQAYLDGRRPSMELPLDVQATAFQRQVWQALQAIPYGETRTYMQLAEGLGNPKAVRAVGRACATNPVSLVVPCHRAVGSDGKLHGFRWGLGRKQALLDMERKGAAAG